MTVKIWGNEKEAQAIISDDNLTIHILVKTKGDTVVFLATINERKKQ